jgi:hypothetical protein
MQLNTVVRLGSAKGLPRMGEGSLECRYPK